MNTYKYRSLPDHEDAIRLLSLSPSLDEAGDLRCELIDTRLSECEIHGYTALSYAWGEQRQSHSINVEGCDFPIGNSLNAALHDLQNKDRSVLLWVDALCINQNDIAERNRQVSRMRDIYSSARETVIYLGEDDRSNTTHSAWNFMERKSTWAMNSEGNIDFELPGVREDEIHFRGNLEDVEIAILSKAWFRRCWALAELIASKTLSVQCGRRKIAWDDFVKIILQTPRQQSQYDRRGQSWLTKFETIRYMDHARSTYQTFQDRDLQQPIQSPKSQGSSFDILDLLAQSRILDLQVFDPRDKLFAFLGTVFDSHPTDGHLFTIDYAMSCAQVYTTFAKWFIDTYESYDLLSYTGKGLNDYEIKLFGKAEFVHSNSGSCEEHIQIQLPSWIPNWCRKEADYKPRIPIVRQNRNQHDQPGRTQLSSMIELSAMASKRRPHPIVLPADEDKSLVSMRKRAVRENHRFSADAQSLACNGSILGTINILGPKLSLGIKDESKYQSIRDHHSGDDKSFYNDIMEEWQTNFENTSHYSFERDPPVPASLRKEKALAFSSAFATIRQSELTKANSIEHHLLERARRSSVSTVDGNIAVPVLDAKSIVDGRRLAIYLISSVEPDHALERSLVLLPKSAQPGDFIAYFKGARVPFVVREVEDAPEVSPESMHAEFKLSVDEDTEIICCEIVGECLVNDFPDIQGDAPDETWEVIELPSSFPSCVFVIS